MTQKRWIGIAIAVILFLISLTMTGSNIEESKEDKLFSRDGFTEVMLEPGGSSGERIVKLSIEGAIVAGSAPSLFSEESYFHEGFMEKLALIKEDSSIKGILLEINSPGGGVYESAEIAKAIKEIQEEHRIPMYVSMRNMAASGGYYVAASADKIYASEETMTGSIGVIMSSLNLSGLFEKIGVSDETIKSGDFKDIGSDSRKMTKEDRAVLQKMIDSSYNRFVDIVADGRQMSKEDVKTVADGRIYDGAQAKEVGLVDEIGFPDEALEALKKDYDLQDAEVFEYSADSLLADRFGTDFLRSAFTTKEDSQAVLINKLLSSFGSADAPRLMYLYGGE